MATEPTTVPLETLADLVERLGGIPLDRIRIRPAPGTATEEDVIAVEASEGRLCELVDGVLVEKAMGFRESLLAVLLAAWLNEFVRPRNLGLVTGADGMMGLFPGLVRIPDVAFASWERFPDGRVPDEPIPALAPDLAVEVLSRSNTKREMQVKREEYFAAGVRLVWIVDPAARTVAAYSSPTAAQTYCEGDEMGGQPVLPSFKLPLGELFAELDRQAGR